MGYEVLYKYHPEIKRGEYNRDEQHEGSIKVGSPYEDVSVDVVAGKIMALMARRNVLVTDVEVYEIVKKRVSFKESDDGITIKNRRYRFDDGPVVVGQDITEVTTEQQDPAAQLQALIQRNPGLALQAQPASPQQVPAVIQQQLPQVQANGRPLRYEVYMPEDEFFIRHAASKNPGMIFTEGRKYPVWSESDRPIANFNGEGLESMHYDTMDDRGVRVTVPANLFVPNVPKLLGDDDPKPQNRGGGGLTDHNLLWGNAGRSQDDFPMPKLR